MKKLKEWIWTDHIVQQLKERKIPRELIHDVLVNPDDIVIGKRNRLIYQKLIGNKLIRLVTENKKLITVYPTNRIWKYLKGK